MSDYNLPCEGCPDPGLPCLNCPAEARAEGERAATERIIGTLTEAANDAQELWVAKRESAAVSERWASEYWRGQMNGLHHIITDLESSIERGEHKEATHE